jgi:2-methylisocitrate lyase-like PEP mutase family enzyme
MPPSVRRAEAFLALHIPGRPFVLPNAWDAASALTLAALPATAALGTTSAAIAWSLGRPDGELDRDAMLEVVARVAAAVDVPVTADVEAGYGDVAGTVAGVLAAGAVGVNLEDGTGDPAAPLRSIDDHAAIVAAARAAADGAGVPLFVNARTDVWWAGAGDPAERLEHAVERLRRYVAAGADGVFAPALVDAPTIGALAAAVGAPLNVLASPGLPPLAELATLGVARVSTGSGTYRAALAGAAAAVARLTGDEALAPAPYGDVQGLLGG